MEEHMYEKTINELWADFDPRGYLLEYYADVGPENFALLQFTVKAFRAIPPGGMLLDFGAGPSIYPLIAAANQVREIHVCDYLDANLSEIRQWLQGEPSAFDWHKFVKVTLELEAGDHPTAQAIQQREAAIRQRITRVFKCDMHNALPISDPQVYDTICTYFCAETGSKDWAQWREALRNILSLLKPNGILLLAAAKEMAFYKVGEKEYPTASIRESDLTQALIEEGFNAQSIVMESIPPDRPSRQYGGVILVMAKRDGQTPNGR